MHYKLKAFGFIVVLLLWASAAMVLGAGIYGSKAAMKCPMMKMMQSEIPGQDKALSAPVHGGMQNTQK